MLHVGDAFVLLNDLPFNLDWCGHGDIFVVKRGKIGMLLGTNNEVFVQNGTHWCAFLIDGMLGFRFINFSRRENILMKAL